MNEALYYRHGYGCDEAVCEFCELLRAKRNKKFAVVKENWKYGMLDVFREGGMVAQCDVFFPAVLRIPTTESAFGRMQAF